MSQQEIIDGLRQGKQEAISVAFDQYGAAIYGVVLRMVGDAVVAEEITQDVFLKLWNKWELFDPKRGTLPSWLLQIARNTALDHLRKKSFQNQLKTDPVDFAVSTSNHPSKELAIDTIGLKEIVESLDTGARTVIELAYFSGMTHTEIAQHLDLPLGTVKTRLRKALGDLKKILALDRR